MVQILRKLFTTGTKIDLMLKNEIKVSVCIPVYNAGIYIGKCVQMLLNQTIDSLELIFVDDASSDDSVQTLQAEIAKYRKDHSDSNIIRKIEIIRLKENHGVAVARKTAIENATGQYVIHCDADDWIEPSMYEDMYNEAITNKAAIVLCDALHLKLNGDKILLSQKLMRYDKFELITKTFSSLAFQTLWNKLVRADIAKNALKQANSPDFLRWSEDCRLCITMWWICDEKISYISYPYYHYIQRSCSLSNNKKNNSPPPQWYLCEISNYTFYEHLLPTKYHPEIFRHQYYLLYCCIVRNLVSANDYKALFKQAKRKILWERMNLKIKAFLLLSCISYPMAIKLNAMGRKLLSHRLENE